MIRKVPWIVLAVALLLATRTVAQRPNLRALHARSTQLLERDDAAAMEMFLDSLQELSKKDSGHSNAFLLMQARWHRHNAQQHAAYRVLDSLSQVVPASEYYLTYLVNYQLAKTLDGLEVFDRARTAAIAAEAAATAARLWHEALQMRILRAEIDLNDAAYEHALSGFHETLDRSQQSSNVEGIGRSLIGIGNVHYHQEQDSLALARYEGAFAHARTHRDAGLILSSALNIGAAMTYVRGEEAAMAFYRSILDTTDASRFPRLKADILSNLASLHSDLDQHNKALVLLDQAMVIFSAQRDTASMAQLDLYRSTALWHLGRKGEAIEVAERCGLRSRSMALRAAAAEKVSEYLSALGRWHPAFEALSNARALKDSLSRQRFTTSIATAQIHYETIQKERRIAEQQQALERSTAESDRRSLQRNMLIGTTAVLGLIALLLFRTIRTRKRLAGKEKELHNEQVDQLLSQQEIKSINAMLEGQEKERDRMAKDLHDRLGSMLGGIKANVAVLEDRVEQMSHDQQYVKVNKLLDQAVGELRQISHDMAAATLSRFGLEKALKDLRDTIHINGRLSVELKTFGLDHRLDRSIELAVYRMVQELVSNVLKHAQARELSIAVTRSPGRLSVVVADDGRGFDTDAAADGMGLANVRSRASALGATVQVDSTPGRGTTVSVEGPVVE